MKQKATLFFLIFSTFLFSQNLSLGYSIGGGGDDLGTSIRVDDSGNIFISGGFNGICDFDPSINTNELISLDKGGDAFIAKYDRFGGLKWVKAIEGNNFQVILGLELDEKNNIYITGRSKDSADFDLDSGKYILTSNSLEYAFVGKYNSDGKLLWINQVECSSKSIGYGIAINANSEVFVTGHFSGSMKVRTMKDSFSHFSISSKGMYVLKLDSLGKVIWAKNTESNGSLVVGRAIAVDKLGKIFIVGEYLNSVAFKGGSDTLKSRGFYDCFILKLGPNGEYEWLKSIGGKDAEQALSIAVDNRGNAIVGGFYSDTVCVLSSKDSMFSFGSFEGFIVKIDSTGNYAWSIGVGGSSEDMIYNIVSDSIGDIYFTGFSEGSVAFYRNNKNLDFERKSISGLFVAKLSANGDPKWIKGFRAVAGAGECVALDKKNKVYVVGHYKGEGVYENEQKKYQAFGSSDVIVLKLSQDTCKIDTTVRIINGTRTRVDCNQLNAKYQWYICKDDGTKVLLPKDTNYFYQFGPFSGYVRCIITLGKCTDTTNCVLGHTEGILDLTKPLIYIYPNPTSEKLFIESDARIKKISIVDILGIQHYVEFPNAKHTLIHTTGLPNGLYFIHIEDERESMTVHKLEIAH